MSVLKNYPFLNVHGHNLRISIVVRAGAKRTAIIGVHDQKLKISIAAIAESGKANQELIDFVSNELKITKKHVQIVLGKQSKFKVLELNDYIISDVTKCIESSLEQLKNNSSRNKKNDLI